MSTLHTDQTKKSNINFIGDATGKKILSLLEKETPLLEQKHRIEAREQKAQLEKQQAEESEVTYVNKDKVLYEGSSVPSYLAAALTSTAITFDEEKHKRLREQRTKQVVKITRKGYVLYYLSSFLPHATDMLRYTLR